MAALNPDTSVSSNDTIDALKKRDHAHYAVHFANRRLVERAWSQACYVQSRIAMDAVMLHLVRAKWLLGRVLGTHSAFFPGAKEPDDLAVACSLFEYVAQRALEIENALMLGESPPAASIPDAVAVRSKCEVFLVDGVPVTPVSSPVVILRGSNRDMGRQYARQILEIYGRFILASHASRSFDEEERTEIARWTRELEAYTPEVLEFASGMAEGARVQGLPMTDEQAIALFTGLRPPATEARPFALAQSVAQSDSLVAAYLGFDEKLPKQEVPSPCSGAMAWGSATSDGALVGASSTDHDCTFQATIVAYPERGNAFIWTPYSANGSIPVLGDFFFGGHPGVNSRGLAYVHHNGSTMGEPKEEWGYGVRRGAAVMHILQFCNTAREALEFMLRLPVGDSGISQGSAGGMFADSAYGFSLEARPGSPAAPKPILREYTFDRHGLSHAFLYGTNNALAPESGHLNAAPANGKGYDYSLEGGWFTFDPEVINSGTAGESIKRRITKNSEGRNRFFHSQLSRLSGRLDLDSLTALYRTTGDVPPGAFDEICANYHRGQQWNCAPGHRANAFVVSFRAAQGELPLYRACVGPLARGLNCRDPGHGYYYYDETNVFWELELATDPRDVVEAARTCALDRLHRADALSSKLAIDFAGRALFARWLEEARSHLVMAEEGRETTTEGPDEAVAIVSRALRHLHWAQVRAGQVVDALDPPPNLSKNSVAA